MVRLGCSKDLMRNKKESKALLALRFEIMLEKVREE
jgi:hypothetical protein